MGSAGLGLGAFAFRLLEQLQGYVLIAMGHTSITVNIWLAIVLQTLLLLLGCLLLWVVFNGTRTLVSSQWFVIWACT